MDNREVFDTYATDLLIRLISSQFRDWDAFRLGIIDGNGMVLRRPRQSELQYWGKIHVVAANLRRLLLATPGGASRLASYHSALFLAQEVPANKSDTNLYSRLKTGSVPGRAIFGEDVAVPVNNVGGGAIAGAGIGPQGEPAFKKRPRLIRRRVR